MENKIDISKISTEQQNQNTTNIDRVTTLEKLQLINNEDAKITTQIKNSLPEIAKLVDASINTIKNGGRVFYIGAGTSGRLGVLDASEILPTYGENNWFVGIIAGGDTALRHPIENAEDSLTQCETDLKQMNFTTKDLLIGLSASGRTPYVVGGLKWAKGIGSKTGSICTSIDTEISKIADYPIEVFSGPEVVTGSTRMKAGTTQKLILNMISTATAISLGKTYGNWMVDVKATNIKLENRAINMLKTLSSLSYEDARELFTQSGKNVKIAFIMHLHKCSKVEAEAILTKNNGFIRV